jgi:uncharacterized protein DUF2730
MLAEWIEIIKLAGAVLGIIGGVLSPIIGVFIWMFRKTFVSHDDLDAAKTERAEQIKEINDRLNMGEQRFGQLENQLSQLPTREQLYELSNELKVVAGNINTALTGIDGVTKQLDGLSVTVNILLENEVKGGK